MELHGVLVVLGSLLLLGLVADELGRRTRVPRVTLLIIFGFVAGPAGFDLIPGEFREWYEFLATVALTMVAFLIGSKLSKDVLRQHGREILIISITAVVVTVVIVALGLAVLGVPLMMSLLLASIATATAPAATQDVIVQNRADGPFTDTLLGIVAIDDAWGLMVFSVVLAFAKSIDADGASNVLFDGLWEISGALLVGLVVGFPAAFLTGRLKRGEPLQAEALGVVFLSAGLAIWIGASFLLAGIVAGIIVVNVAPHHRRAFHQIEHIEWPFMILFFVLAGATLRIDHVAEIGFAGSAYIALRVISRIAGGWLGATLAGTPQMQRHWIGVALLPQAGVALGMALIAGSYMPELAQTLLVLVVGTTVVFEIIGPLGTQTALRRVGEAR